MPSQRIHENTLRFGEGHTVLADVPPGLDGIKLETHQSICILCIHINMRHIPDRYLAQPGDTRGSTSFRNAAQASAHPASGETPRLAEGGAGIAESSDSPPSGHSAEGKTDSGRWPSSQAPAENEQVVLKLRSFRSLQAGARVRAAGADGARGSQGRRFRVTEFTLPAPADARPSFFALAAHVWHRACRYRGRQATHRGCPPRRLTLTLALQFE